MLKKYAKYAKVVHLWNMRITQAIEYNHHPALPDCKPEDGWAPIEDYLRIIKEENPQVLIMFEHRSDRITDEQLDACYQWISRIMHENLPLAADAHETCPQPLSGREARVPDSALSHG